MNYSAMFYPVGQGLFSEGYVFFDRHSVIRATFRWIYDCGSVSDTALVEHAIRSRPTAPLPNMLVISHFDRDHISGIVSLVHYTSVDTLLLPYLSLEQRVSAAIRTGLGPGHPVAAFCLDPVRFLAAHAGERIKGVVFVPPGGGPVRERTPGQDNNAGSLNMQTRRPTDAEAEIVTVASVPFSVSFLSEGTGIEVGAEFEFVPYNDGHLAKAASISFESDVHTRRTALLSGTGNASIALREIRDCYDGIFGKSSFKRNVISLFLYASPIRPPRRPARVFVCSTSVSPMSPRRHCGCPRCCFCGSRGRAVEKAGLLYTGDGFLNTAERYISLEKHLGAQRMTNLACVQVPHHGSRHNAYPGLAARLASQVSVFSSDPKNRLGHPHKEVRADFAANGPCQVDRSSGLVVDVYA